MKEIKPYKNKLTVELKDWTKLYSDKTLEELNQALNIWWSFIEIDWVLFNIFEFKKAYIEKINSIEDFICALDKETQKKVKEREKEKKEKIWKWFESIQEIQNYIEKNLM